MNVITSNGHQLVKIAAVPTTYRSEFIPLRREQMKNRLADLPKLLLLTLFINFISTVIAQESLPPPPRPLVFIPGILGSELWINDERVWGGLWDMRNLAKLAIPGGPREAPPA